MVFNVWGVENFVVLLFVGSINWLLMVLLVEEIGNILFGWYVVLYLVDFLKIFIFFMMEYVNVFFFNLYFLWKFWMVRFRESEF